MARLCLTRLQQKHYAEQIHKYATYSENEQVVSGLLEEILFKIGANWLIRKMHHFVMNRH